MVVGCAAIARSSGPKMRGSATYVVQPGKNVLFIQDQKHSNQGRHHEELTGPSRIKLRGDKIMERKVRGSIQKRIEAGERASTRIVILRSKRHLHRLHRHR